MTICIAGKNKIAVQGMTYLLQHFSHHKLMGCQNKNDDETDSWQPSFAAFCKRSGIPVVSLDELYKVPDLLLISLEYDRIVKPGKFISKQLFNIHFSKLPKYKGMYTSVMPLLNGESESGVTLHYIDKGIDTGDIIDQIVFPLQLTTTASELYDLYLENASLLFERNINNIIEGTINSYPQPAAESTYFSKASLNFSDLRMDLKKTAFEVHNQIRAYTFRDYQLPVIYGKRIYRSKILPLTADDKPATIAAENDWYLQLNTIDYQIQLFIDKHELLTEAAETGNIRLLKNLIAHNYPVNIRTKQGWDIMIIASYHNQAEFVQFLIEAGWNINTQNYKGTSALMYAMTVASRQNNMKALQQIAADKNVDWSMKDKEGKDVFWYAQQYGNTDVISFIDQYKKEN